MGQTRKAPDPRAGAATPLPWMKVLIIGAVVFADTFGTLVIFPFMPFMVHGFFPAIATDQLGLYVGILASAFSVGGLCGSVMWGKLADAYGRRPIMLCGLVGTLLSISMFGFSVAYPMAVTARFLWGFLNGNIGVAKSYLSEILDNSNMASGFSVLGMTSGMGRLVGPMSGAFLANPATQYPRVFGSAELFVRFPYALPCMAGAAICILTIVMAYFYLAETLQKPGEVESVEMDLLGEDDIETMALWGPATRPDQEEEADQDGASSGDATDVNARKRCCCFKSKYSLLPGGRPQASRCCGSSAASFHVLRERGVWTSTTLYGLLALVSIIVQELFTLWTITDPAHGGFHFTVQDIGLVMLMSAPSVMLLQAVVFRASCASSTTVASSA